jgi:hypothetical protein
LDVETAYRAAIATDPGHVGAHSISCSSPSAQSGDGLGGAAVLWDQAVEHLANAVARGYDERMLNMAKAHAARVRAALLTV